MTEEEICNLQEALQIERDRADSYYQLYSRAKAEQSRLRVCLIQAHEMISKHSERLIELEAGEK